VVSYQKADRFWCIDSRGRSILRPAGDGLTDDILGSPRITAHPKVQLGVQISPDALKIEVPTLTFHRIIIFKYLQRR
jgi:hypothetical protein